MSRPPRIDIGAERIVFTEALQPYLFKTGSGSLWFRGQLGYPAGYRQKPGHAPDVTHGFVISRNAGVTWKRWWYRPGRFDAMGIDEPMFEADADVPLFYSGAGVQFPDGLIRLFHFHAHGPDGDGCFAGQLFESRDDLATVDKPRPMRICAPQVVGGEDDSGYAFRGMAIHSSTVRLEGDDLLMTAYGWFAEDRRHDDHPRYRSMLLRSGDRGDTWSFVSVIAGDAEGETAEGYCEPTMIRIGAGAHAGRLIAHMRAGSEDHALYQSHSDDLGATWSRARALELRWVNPRMIQLSGGTIASIVGRRNWNPAHPRYAERGIYLGLSPDGGDTWHTQRIITAPPHAGADAPMTFYADIAELDDGSLLVVYDIGHWVGPVRYVAMRRIILSV